MSHFIITDAPVLGFCMNETCIFLLCGKELIKADKLTGTIDNRIAIFEKDGKARLIRTNGAVLAVSDFCKLSVFRHDTLERLGEWNLGSDLSSDICGLFIDEAFIYASIRNGKLIRFDLSDYSQTTYEIGVASSWSLTAYKDKIIAGTVDGKLLFFEIENMNCVKKLQISKRNIKSLYVNGDVLYAAGQDEKFYVIDLPNFELIRKQNNVHKKMFDIIGVQGNILYTVSHSCSEICAWNSDGAKVKIIPYELRLSGSSCIDANAIYISSRNICGVDQIDLSDIQNEAI